MQLSKLIGLLVPPFLVLACGSTSLLDTDDNMRQSGGQNGSGEVVVACSHCFDTTCSWQTAQCQGDPACARWLSDLRTCPADDTHAPSSSCIQRLTAPSTSSGNYAAEALRTCLGSGGGCCVAGTSSTDADGSSPALGDGGSKGNLDAGSGVLGDAGAGWSDASDAIDSGTSHPSMKCDDCIYTFKHAPTESACGEAAYACYYNKDVPDCRTFMLGYFACHENPAQLPGEMESAKCLLGVAEKTSDKAQTAFMQVMNCAYARCEASCIPPDYRACSDCRRKNCPDEMEAIMMQPDAQNLMWCRDAAAGNPQKIEECNRQYDEARPILKALSTCSQAACASACK